MSQILTLKIVLANYIFKCAGTTGTDWQVKGVAIAGYTIVTLGKSFLCTPELVTNDIQY